MNELGLRLDDVAARMKTTPATVSRLKNEKRRLTLPWLRRFAVALDCKVEDLISEGSESAGVTVPVVGYVGAGEKVENFDDSGELDRVKAPPNAGDTVALIVRGESMWPKYEEGTLLFYVPTDHVAADCMGRISIVQVKNGPTLVKRVRVGSSDGRFRLVSLRAPEIEDAELLWASRVLWTQEP